MEIDPEARPQNCQILIDEIDKLPELADKPVQKKETFYDVISDFLAKYKKEFDEEWEMFHNALSHKEFENCLRLRNCEG